MSDEEKVPADRLPEPELAPVGTFTISPTGQVISTITVPKPGSVS